MSELFGGVTERQSQAEWVSEVKAAGPEPVVEAEAPAPAPEEAAPGPESLEEQEAEIAEIAEIADNTPEQPKQERHVPLAALHEERNKRQALEAKISQLENWARNVSREVEQDQEQEAPQQIDIEKDPIGALKALQAQLEETRGREQQQLHMTNLKRTYQASALQFQAVTPDFKEAYQHTIKARASQLQALGYSEPDAYAITEQEEMGLVATALQNGQNPAAVVYAYAKSYGYSGKVPEKPSAVPPDPQVAAHMQEVRKAQATSLAKGGKPPGKELSAESVLQLRGAAYDSASDKLWANMEAAAKPNGSMFRR